MGLTGAILVPLTLSVPKSVLTRKYRRNTPFELQDTVKADIRQDWTSLIVGHDLIWQPDLHFRHRPPGLAPRRRRHETNGPWPMTVSVLGVLFPASSGSRESEYLSSVGLQLSTCPCPDEISNPRRIRTTRDIGFTFNQANYLYRVFAAPLRSVYVPLFHSGNCFTPLPCGPSAC